MAAGRESSPAASSVRGKDGRITASSFRLLTARLKSAPATTLNQPLTDSPPQAPDTALAITIAEPREYRSEDAPAVHAPALPPFEPISQLETDAPLLAGPDAEPVSNIAAIESVELEAFEPLQAIAGITLPEFTPVQWQGPDAVAQEYATQLADTGAPAPDVMTVDVLRLPDFVPAVAAPANEQLQSIATHVEVDADNRLDPVMAFETVPHVEREADIEPEPEPELEPDLPQPFDVAIAEDPVVQADDVQPRMAFELQADSAHSDDQPADESEPPLEQRVEIESVAVETDELPADVQDEQLPIDLDAQSTGLALEGPPIEVLPEHPADADAQLPFGMMADAPAESEEDRGDAATGNRTVALASAEQWLEAPGEQPAGEPEEPPEVVPEDPAEPVLVLETPDVPADSEAEGQEEPTGAPSELAGRVVDAMIKTISTAIYAKPTASERASFLREVAALMQEASDGNSAVQQPHVGLAIAAVGTASRLASVSNATTTVRADVPVAEAIAERLGTAPLLKAVPAAKAEDPFTLSSLPARFADVMPPETVDPDEESGDLALTLLDMMSGGTGSLPHERTLAADTLLRILPRIPVKQLLSVVERVAIMETPPALLVAKLIRDSRHEVVGPLLERCSHISDQDLMNAAPDGDTAKLRMVARRRILSTVLSDFLISIGETGVLLTLIRNPGAALSHEAFFRLADHATKHSALLAPLATRADLPPPVAFELFWHVPPELRRFIFSRFLTDSETLNKILRITLSTHGNDGGDAMGEGKFPPREAMDQAIDIAASYRLEEASDAFAEMGGITRETAFRILSDREGEPLTVLLKALGSTRARFEEAITKLRIGDSEVLRPDRNPEELQAIFDGLSFNKARILLTYWDWFTRKAGPYAPHN